MGLGRVERFLTGFGVVALLASGQAIAADLMTKAPAPAVPETCKATLLGPSFGPTIKANPDQVGS